MLPWPLSVQKQFHHLAGPGDQLSPELPASPTVDLKEHWESGLGVPYFSQTPSYVAPDMDQEVKGTATFTAMGGINGYDFLMVVYNCHQRA